MKFTLKALLILVAAIGCCGCSPAANEIPRWKDMSREQRSRLLDEIREEATENMKLRYNESAP